jgi:hypothetical protein
VQPASDANFVCTVVRKDMIKRRRHVCVIQALSKLLL